MAGTKGRAAGRARAGQALPAFATGLNRPLPWKEVGLSATRGDSAAADKRAACRHVATSGSLVGFSPTVAQSGKLKAAVAVASPAPASDATGTRRGHGNGFTTFDCAGRAPAGCIAG